MWKYRLYYGAVLLAALFLFLWSNTAPVLLFLLLLIFFPVCSGVMTGIWMHTLRLELLLPETCVTGQEVSIRLKLTKKAGWLARQLVLPYTIHHHMFERQEEKRLSIFPGNKKEELYTLPVQTTLCGEVEIRTREIYCYDVLHLFCVKKAYRTEKKMSIYPALLPVSLVLRQRPKSKETGDIYDEDLRGNDTSEIFDIRNYQEGDSLRAVHWKLSSKMNRLLLREFSRPASFDTILLFSLSGKDRVPDKRISRVASLVLSLDHALLELEMEHQVGCMIHGRLLEMPVRSRSGGMQLRDSIMGMHAEGEPSDVIRSFMKQGRQFAYTKVIYVTAEPEGALLKNLAEQVNLSVFVPTEGEKDSIDNSGGYELIALSEKEPAAGRYIYI